MDEVFSALANHTRRALLDRLRLSDGQTLGELCAGLEMSRQAVTKHLRLLEDANLVVVRWRGREKLHFLNPVPIREIHDRWLDQYRSATASALLGLKQTLENDDHE